MHRWRGAPQQGETQNEENGQNPYGIGRSMDTDAVGHRATDAEDDKGEHRRNADGQSGNSEGNGNGCGGQPSCGANGRWRLPELRRAGVPTVRGRRQGTDGGRVEAGHEADGDGYDYHHANYGTDENGRHREGLLPVREHGDSHTAEQRESPV